MDPRFGAAIRDLMRADEATLMTEGELRLSRIRVAPNLAGELESSGQVAMGSGLPGTTMRRLVARTNRELYELVCGNDEECAQDRRAIRDAFGVGDDSAAIALAAAGISYCGLAPAIAVVVAVVLIRRIVPATQRTLCEVWHETLAL